MKELSPRDVISTDSLPLVALDPDQAPEAEQLEALDEFQVKVTLVLKETELALDDKDTVAAGVGGGPESDPPPPPPPQEVMKIAVKIKKKWLNFTLSSYSYY